MNLVITCVGRRCELIEYFRKELNPDCKVIAVDITDFAPALYLADKSHILEKDIDNLENYIDQLVSVCLEEKATHILTLIDPELELLAKYRAKFESNNITLILSSDDVIESTFDKYLFYCNFKDSLNLLTTYHTKDKIKEALDNNSISCPLIAKPRCGSGSVGLTTIHYRNEFDTLKFNHKYHYVFQKSLNCVELGIDAYFDLITGKLASVFIKEKVALRSGETDKAVSVFNQKVFDEIKKLETHGGFKGPVDIDVFIDSDGGVFINEINPRFGGGYPMAHNCGADFVKLIAKNMRGETNEPIVTPRYKLGVMMMKHNQALFKDGDNIYSG